MARSLNALLLFCAVGVSAELLPQFQLDTCAWNATDVVMVTEGAVIDGEVEVLETWKGELRPGAKLTIPELAAFASEESRTTSTWLADLDGPQPRRVSGSWMILFLVRKDGQWTSADGWSGPIRGSVAWIEGHQLFAFMQQTIPGDLALLPLEISVREARRKVAEIVDVQRQLLPRRGDAARVLHTSSVYVRWLAIAELAEHGEEGLPGLRAILLDHALSSVHPEAIKVLGKAGGVAVAPELTEILRQQLVERNQAKISAALYALRSMHYAGGRDVIRATWEAWPGNTHIGRECMYLLAESP